MTTQHILYEVSEGIATITLNRPDRLNAWTRLMEREVRQVMQAASADDTVRVIILTGAGRGFCAGADMELLNQAHSGDRRADQDESVPAPFDPAAPVDFQQRYAYFPAVPKPIIAAVNGPAAGLGLIMALYCDLRFASDTAIFTTAFSRRGLIAEHGISWLLPRLTGLAHALDLMLSARKVDAGEALRMNLVNRVHPAEELMSSTRAYARELATKVSPRSMKVMKRQLYAAQFQTLAEATKAADQEMIASFSTDDFREGVAHFVEKRAPAFTGA